MHLAKHMQFHGVDYIVVPKELWESAKELAACHVEGESISFGFVEELLDNMLAYEGSNEPAEIPNE